MKSHHPRRPKKLRYRILLADDDRFVLKTLGPALEGQGWVVTTVESGEAAFQALACKSFDLVITDLAMADVDGIAVLKRVKELHADTMVMILTGYGELTSAINALRSDADDYVLKPCAPEEMFFRIRRCLDKLELRKKTQVV